GNSASATQTISVIDTTSPIIEIFDYEIEANISDGSNAYLSFPTILEIQDVEIANDAPEVFPLGETIVTWTATDTSGNSASATQTISVIDTTSPTMTIPENIEIEAESVLTKIEELGEIIYEDFSGISSISNDAPEMFPLGETIVTWTATDKFGNSSSSSQIITVQACGNSPSYYNILVGSEDDDLLTGTTLPDLIFGKGGDDIISGSKGNDCILGGEGNDIIFGNDGNDNISGQNGNDIIKGHSGEDFVFGGFGFDVIDGGGDIDTCKIIDEQNNDIIIKCELNE
nr:HYR domain-containing protein [Candidatus Nitrosopelagicus sp.]